MARPRSNADMLLEIPSFHGGVDYDTDPDKLQPYVASEIFQMLLDELGNAVQRPGIELVNTVGAAGDRVISAFFFINSSKSVKQMIIHTSAGELKYANMGSVPGAWTNIATGLSTTARMSFVVFLDQVWMTNGVNDLRSWDGTTQTTYASAPKGKYIALWKDTLWQAGVTGNLDRVYSSAAGDGTTWPALNFVDIGKGQGPGITGLADTDTALVVFKERATHAIYDPVEYTNRQIDNSRGTLSHHSIVKYHGGIYFAAHDGICQYLGDAPNQNISRPISYLWEHPTSYSTVDRWVTYTYGERVGWRTPFANLDGTIIEFYPERKEPAWSVLWLKIRNIVVVPEVTDGTPELYVFSDNTNQYGRFCFTNNSGAYFGYDWSDTTQIIKGYITTGWFDLDQPDVMKYLKRMRMRCRGHKIFVDVFTDYDPDTVVKTYDISSHGEADFQTAKFFEEITIYTDVYFRSIKFKFYRNPISTDIDVGGDSALYVDPNTKIFIESRDSGWAISKALAVVRPLGTHR